MPEPFYRPQPAVACHRFAQNCPENALREIVRLIDAGPPQTLSEARRRISAIRLIATEGIGNETLFEMVGRIVGQVVSL